MRESTGAKGFLGAGFGLSVEELALSDSPKPSNLGPSLPTVLWVIATG